MTSLKVGDLVRLNISKIPGQRSNLEELSNSYGIGIVIGHRPPYKWKESTIKVYWTRSKCDAYYLPSLLMLVSAAANATLK